jgi:hypothetical protein
LPPAAAFRQGPSVNMAQHPLDAKPRRPREQQQNSPARELKQL